MATMTFNDEYLWNWISDDSISNSHPSLFPWFQQTVLRENDLDRSYIASISPDSFPSPDMVGNLRNLLPRKYGLEVEYCLAAYASVFGRLFPPLAAHVQDLGYIEWLLYVEPGYPNYRDHLVHAFKTACVATWMVSVGGLEREIVDLQFGRGTHFEAWLKRNSHLAPHSKADKKRIVELAVVLAALFHDFGYGYYFLRQYRERLGGIYQWMEDEHASNAPGVWKAKSFLKSLAAAFLESHHLWLNKEKPKQHAKRTRELTLGSSAGDLLGLNHSMASALFILQVADFLVQARAIGPALELAFQLAAEAAMIHDMVKPTNYCHLGTGDGRGHFLSCQLCDESPVAALLILCDEIACWNRFKYSTVQPENDPKKLVNKMNPSGVPREILLEVTGEEIAIRPSFERKNDDETRFRGNLERKLGCFIPRRGKFPQFFGRKVRLD